MEVVVTEVQLTEWQAEAELGPGRAGIAVGDELLRLGADCKSVGVSMHFFLISV